MTWDVAIELGDPKHEPFAAIGKGAGQVTFDRKAGRVGSSWREVRIDEGFEERVEVKRRAAKEK